MSTTQEHVRQFPQSGYQIKVTIDTRIDQQYSCCDKHKSRLHIKYDDKKAWEYLGQMTAYTVVKKSSTPARGDWRSELLRRTPGQNFRMHADDISDDLPRVMQMLFTETGEVEKKFKQQKAALERQDKLHYISLIQLGKKFAGKVKGMGRSMVSTYLDALQSSFDGLVLLAPAPVHGAVKGTYNFRNIKKKITKGYKKSGFKLWNDAKCKGAISIMGLDILQRQVQPRRTAVKKPKRR